MRTTTGAGLAAAAIATFIAIPATAHAAPTTEEQLTTVEAAYDDAAARLAGLKDDRANVKDLLKRAENTIKTTPVSVSDATEAVGEATTAVDRLSQLAGYSSTRSLALEQALETRDGATRRINQLGDQIAEQKDKVADLADKRDELEAEIAAAATPETSTETGSSDSSPASVSSDGAGAVEFAKAQLGDPYQFGATGPDSYDCSGLTQAAWAAAGVSIGRDTVAQWNGLAHISRDALQPGDLVFYSGQSHVAMYVGDGQVIHAPTEGDVVKYSGIDMMSIDGYARP